MDYTFFVYVNGDNTGINEENSINKLKSFPNPTSGSFTSEITLQQSQKYRIFYFKIAGESDFSKNIYLQSGNNELPVDINLCSGLYFLSVQLENGKVFSERILFKN